VTAIEAVVLLACGLIGWALVSWVFAIIRQQRAPPIPMSTSPLAAPPPRALPAPPGTASLDDIASSWYIILGVGEHATGDEIDRAYRMRLAECEQPSLAMQPGRDDSRETESRRARIHAAYQFIRPRRLT
jgi:hypothetical protein